MIGLLGKLRYSEPNAALSYGDVVAVKRHMDFYHHFGVYAGGGKIIHYAAEKGDFGKRDMVTVHLSPFREFLGDSRNYYVVSLKKGSGIRAYSPEETVRRAYSRLGESSYNLITNNCEHFALWCKTGVNGSHQVEALLAETVTALSAVALTAAFISEDGKRINRLAFGQPEPFQIRTGSPEEIENTDQCYKEETANEF